MKEEDSEEILKMQYQAQQILNSAVRVAREMRHTALDPGHCLYAFLVEPSGLRLSGRFRQAFPAVNPQDVYDLIEHSLEQLPGQLQSARCRKTQSDATPGSIVVNDASLRMLSNARQIARQRPNKVARVSTEDLLMGIFLSGSIAIGAFTSRYNLSSTIVQTGLGIDLHSR